MKAYVINQDQIKQYSLLLVGSLMVSFVLGYFTGSTGFNVDESVTQNISEKSNNEKTAEIAPNAVKADLLDEKDSASKKPADTSKQKPPVNKVVAKAPVKQPAAKKVPVVKSVAKPEPKKQPSSKATLNKVQKNKEPVKVAVKTKESEKKATSGVTTKSTSAKVKTAEVKTAAVSKLADKKTDLAEQQKNTAKTATTGKRVYSVQAGMFASKDNAMSFIEKLNEKKFDAYVTDFESSSGATKYNVRVGRFEQREQARELLQEFQKSFSSPAYVVIAP